MTSLLQFLPRVRGLKASPEVDALVADLLGQLLLVEGPPVDPIPDVSEDVREAIVRSDKGRPRCFAKTWTTGPWRCLLMDTHSVPMGRPIFLAREEGEGRGPTRTITDSKSTAFQRTIVAACRDLAITAPMGEGAVHAVVGSHRTFLAWRHRELDEPMNREIRGDADNFAKNLLDGLQQAGVLPNDRGVFRLTAAKELPPTWADAPPSLEEAIRREAMARHAQGQPFETIRVEMRLAKAHVARIFPDYNPARAKSPRPSSPGADLAAARQAADLILKGSPYKDARRTTGAPGKALAQAVAQALRPRVLEGKTTLRQLATELQLDTRSVARLFSGDEKALEALAAAAKASAAPRAPRKVSKASQALLEAVAAVLAPKNPMTTTEAAAHFKVNLGSLRSRVTRARAKGKPKAKGAGRTKGTAAPAKASAKPGQKATPKPAKKKPRKGATS